MRMLRKTGKEDGLLGKSILELRYMKKPPESDLGGFAYENYCLFFSAASTNPLNKGCGRFGLDFSSGCAWVAMKNGCSGSSHISTIRPSGERPDNFIPFSVKTAR